MEQQRPTKTTAKPRAAARRVPGLEGVTGKLRVEVPGKTSLSFAVHDGVIEPVEQADKVDAVIAFDDTSCVDELLNGRLNPIVAALQQPRAKGVESLDAGHVDGHRAPRRAVLVGRRNERLELAGMRGSPAAGRRKVQPLSTHGPDQQRLGCPIGSCHRDDPRVPRPPGDGPEDDCLQATYHLFVRPNGSGMTAARVCLGP